MCTWVAAAYMVERSTAFYEIVALPNFLHSQYSSLEWLTQ